MKTPAGSSPMGMQRNRQTGNGELGVRDLGRRDVAEHEAELPDRPKDPDPTAAVRSVVDDDLTGAR